MSLTFSLRLPCQSDLLYNKMTDFKNLKKYLPMQFEKILVLENPNDLEQFEIKNNQIVTEETIVSESVLKTTIKQKSLHTLKEKELHTQIIEGPAKGTLINISFTDESQNNESLISVEIKLKLGIKYFFLSPIVKKEYKKLITSILYRINTEIQNELKQ